MEINHRTCDTRAKVYTLCSLNNCELSGFTGLRWRAGLTIAKVDAQQSRIKTNKSKVTRRGPLCPEGERECVSSLVPPRRARREQCCTQGAHLRDAGR